MQKKMTRKAETLYRQLCGGGRLASDICGWRELSSGRKLREETRDALAATKQLLELHVQGKHIRYELIVHQNCVDKWRKQIEKEGKRVIAILPAER